MYGDGFLLKNGRAIHKRINHIKQFILSILGAFDEIGLSGSKIFPPSTFNVGFSPSGFAIASEINPKINEPKPNPPTTRPLMRPFLLGKYSQPEMIGHM